ncbi:hypothetical protein Zmor_009053 [Zophobas morio]|jgi:hypothetical protein|uniref:Uncharacterized protein n=1 Tax=Zophobas morio TaxID=2755281 RepID=A0AA38HLW0_9CUCU|nr:hypothetical protein Zmor_009053 [Zophobas morio]
MSHREHEDSLELEMGNTSCNPELPSSVAPPLRQNNKLQPVLPKTKVEALCKTSASHGAQNIPSSRTTRQVIKTVPATADECRAITKLMRDEALLHFTH